jgi:hypothetical protein
MPDKNPPPTCNTGVEKKFVSQTVDWLEGTFHRADRPMLPEQLTGAHEPCHPFHGYTEAFKFSDGRIELKNPSRPDMGVHIQWSGDALRATPMPVSDLCKFLYSSDFIFTRVDFAIDCFNLGVKPSDVTEKIKNGHAITRAKKFPAWHDAKGRGYTQYIGTKASEIFVRVYDKAAEMGTEQNHTRIELVAKKYRAQQAIPTIIRGGDFRPLVLGFVRFQEWEEWEEIMETNAVSLPSEKKPSATEQWLMRQAAPALARLIVEQDSHDVWMRFKETVADHVSELQSTKRQTVN